MPVQCLDGTALVAIAAGLQQTAAFGAIKGIVMIRRALFGIAIFQLGATAACANPFNLPKGQGRIILNTIFTGSSKQFGADGHVVGAPDYDQANVYVSGEYGLTDKLNILFAPSFRAVSVEGPGNDSTGLGHTELGARYEVGKTSNFVFDLQGTVRLPGTGRSYGVAQIGNNDTQFDMRALTGYTFGKSFASLEAGYRFRSGRPPNEVHIDATIGTRPTPRLLLLASAYGTISDGSGSSAPLTNPDGTSFSYDYPYRYYDVSASAVYSVSSRVAVQLGFTGTVAGKNALRQRGPVVGLWYTF